jgi:hypothetical protein
MSALKHYFAAWTLEDWGDLAVIAVAVIVGWILFGSNLVVLP